MDSTERENETQKLQKFSASDKRLRVQITEGDLVCFKLITKA